MVQCNDCVKQSVCKYVEVAEKEKEKLQTPSESNGIIKTTLTCTEFLSKPMARTIGTNIARKVGD